MLLFYCADEAELPTLRTVGLLEGTPLWTSYEAACAACSEHVLAIDPLRFDPALLSVTDVQVRPGAVPPTAFRNLDPLLSTRPIAAGGGIVVRPGVPAPEVLLIFRRGVWDLPKGKQDDGEAIDTCALREVREEVGIERLTLGEALGTTVHGYERKGRFEVKTTFWYLMSTPERTFTPQAEEDIEAVAWVPWPEAVEQIGYRTFRHHLRAVEPRVRAAMSRSG